MLLKQWDVVELKEDIALEVALGALYRHSYKGNYTKHALNWWQNPPSYFYTQWSLTETCLERIAPCYCIVESILNTPTHKGYLLLLSGEMLRQQPYLSQAELEQTRTEENRLLRLMPYLLGKKREKTSGLFLFVPFDKAKNYLAVSLPVDGRNLEGKEAIVWKRHYDSWFDWTVKLSHPEIESLIVQVDLTYDPHCYLDVQGLKLKISRPQLSQLINFGAFREELAHIQIYPRMPKGISINPENHPHASFENPVIQANYDASRLTVNLDVETLSKEICIYLEPKSENTIK